MMDHKQQTTMLSGVILHIKRGKRGGGGGGISRINVRCEINLVTYREW